MIPIRTITFNRLRGINTKKANTQKNQNEANLATNGFFDTTGAFVKRRGFRRINDTEIDTGYDIDSVYQFGTSLIMAGDTDLKERTSGGTVSDLTTSLTGSFFDFEEYLPYSTNYLFATNGEDSPFKYDGTTLTNLSIARPSSAPSASSSTGGSLSTGDYLVRVTYIRDNGSDEVQESNPSDSASVTVAGNRIALSSIPTSSDAQVTGRRIYCTRVDGAILFYVGEIADNTTTTFNIDTEPDPLTASELDYDHDAAPNAYMIEKYKDRLVLAGNPDKPDTVYLSKRQNVWYFPAGEFADASNLSFSIGETITSIKSYFDLVFIFGQRGNIYILTGTSEENFTLSQMVVDQRVTAVADRCTLVQDNWCYFLNTDGYYRTNGQIIQKMSMPLDAYFDPENSQGSEYNVYGFSTGFNQTTPVAIYYKPYNQILLWITGAGQNDYVNNICFVCHLDDISVEGSAIFPNFSVYTGFATRCTCQYLTDNVYKYVLTSQEDGFLFEAEKGRYDGAAVNSTVTSSTNTTASDSTASWTTNAFIGMWISIRTGTGKGQFRFITANTSTQITVDHAWDTNPDSSSEFSVGGIWFQYTHSYNSYGTDNQSKRLVYIRPRFTSEGDATVLVSFGYDFSDTENNDLDEKTVEVAGSSLWDVAQWDDAIWDGPTVFDSRLPGTRSRIHRWGTVKIKNLKADEGVQYDGLDKLFQIKGTR